jgi:hypothetical protein
LLFESVAIKKYTNPNIGAQILSTTGALAFGRTVQRRSQVIPPAAHAESKGNTKLFTTSANRIGLFLVAYQTYAQSSPTKVMLKLVAIPATPYLTPMTNPVMHTGAATKA